ncbi:MAG TPA: large conductance mechanosensitive channel protein MscL [Actinomycetota bacterium]|jgi:large conductance mechanosensitive channel
MPFKSTKEPSARGASKGLDAAKDVAAAKGLAAARELLAGREFKAAREFKAFVLRGNVVDLAVGVVIGAAFGTLVRSLVVNFVTPMTGVFGKFPDFGNLRFTLGHATLRYGAFLNDLIAFVLIAAVVFFFVVKPLNKLVARTSLQVGQIERKRDCPYCYSRIAAAATRCAFCAQEVEPVPGSPVSPEATL